MVVGIEASAVGSVRDVFGDWVVTALTLWRENRGGGEAGMQSVANVITNRADKIGTSFYKICTAPEQFSSITVEGNQTALWPAAKDAEWIVAQRLAKAAIEGRLEDLTQGATNYYAPAGMKNGAVPGFAARMTFTVEIAGQRFFK